MIKPNFLEQYYSYCEYHRKDSSFFCLVCCFVNHKKHHGELKSKGMPGFFYSSYLVYEHAIKHKCKTWISQRDFGKMAAKLKDAEEEISTLQTDLRTQDSKLEYLENQSRRNNIRASGILESPDETWEVAEAKVKQAIQEQLGVDVDIERAHRVERRNRDRSSQDTQQRKPRTIVCKLRCWKQREAVLKKARKSKPSGLFISGDLALATLQRRAAQVGKLREAKQAGKIAYFVLDRLVIRDKKYHRWPKGIAFFPSR